MKKRLSVLAALLTALFLLASCMYIPVPTPPKPTAYIDLPLIEELPEASGGIDPGEEEPTPDAVFDPSDVPEYAGEPYAVIHGNVPFFTAEELTDVSFETYAELDGLGRCGTALASVGTDIMPTEERGSIGSVKPTGWQSTKYSIVDGKYLYNRCHLIGYQLTGENANRQNLITGTRYLNVTGMLPFENMVADFVKETEYHVLYRVTPLFTEDELVARGVLMEARSVEDDGEGILFCVCCYNVQPGIVIDYATGESREEAETVTLILNTNSEKYHLPDCPHASGLAAGSRREYIGTIADIEAQGYAPCGSCFGNQKSDQKSGGN